MPDEKILNSNVDAIKDHIRTINSEVRGFESDQVRLHGWEKTFTTETLLSATNQAEQLVDELAGRLSGAPQEQTDAIAILALNSIDIVEAELEALDGKIAATMFTPALSSWSKVKGIVKTAIKAISKHLWQIIVTALTLKEWTVKGSLGSGIFGLASVEIGLKFGK